MKLNGKGRGKAYTLEELHALHTRFEQDNIKAAKKKLGAMAKDDIQPDNLPTFLLRRTNLCPHKVISPLSYYWIETMACLDGEMGLTLPCAMEEAPALFFDALAIIRNQYSLARKEDNGR